jgi:hypothetical protein
MINHSHEWSPHVNRTQGALTNQPHNVEVAAHRQKFLVNMIAGDRDNAPLEVTLNWTTALIWTTRSSSRASRALAL